MLQTAICDDNKLYLENAAKIVARECRDYSPEISTFSGGAELIKALNKGYRPDILILDIVLEEDSSGIDVAKEVNRICPDCGIIFLTAFISYASDVYETNHRYFIVKSQLEQRIRAAVDKALPESRDKKYLSFSEHYSTTVLPAGEVICLERSLKKTIIYHNSGRRYETYTKPSEILKNAGSIFIQCHKSFYVNMDEVAAAEGDFFLMRDGIRIPISRSRKKESKDKFHAYISSMVGEN